MLESVESGQSNDSARNGDVDIKYDAVMMPDLSLIE